MQPAAFTAPLARPAGPSATSPLPAPASSRWPRRILVANLVGQVGIVVTGGAVRLTGSGLGCSTWPQCEPGQFAPVMHEATSWHPYVEFGNRTVTGVLMVLALATAWVAWRRHDRSLSFRRLGLVPLAGVLAQALIGGLTVLVDLNPAVVGVHLLISMLLIAASTALLVRHGEGDGPAVPVVDPRVRALGRGLVPLVAVVLALGVVATGSGPHSGDEEVAYRFALDPVAVSRVHSASVWLFLAGVVALTVAARRSGAPRGPRRAAVVLLVVTLVQGLIGYVQYVTGLPEVLVGAHMLGASLLVVAQTRLVTALRMRPPLPVT